MLDAVTFADLRQLAKPNPTNRVSISLPTSRSGAEVTQGPTRLKKLLTLTDKHLKNEGIRPSDTEKLLAPASALLTNDNFWANTELGLALYLDGDGMRTYRLGATLPERYAVADRFQVRPLVPAAVASSTFWVLAISLAKVRLLRGHRDKLEVVDVEQMPTGIDEALGLDDRERQLQSHGADRVGAGRMVASFHGQGGIEDSREHDRARYCRVIDEHVAREIGDSNAPVVLAGDRRLVDEYRKQSRLTSLAVGSIGGNPDLVAPRALADGAWPIVEPVFEQDRLMDWERFAAAPADRRASSLDAAVVAAVDGRVASLTVPLDAERPGQFDVEARTLRDAAAGSGDLFDLAVSETLLHGGRVHAVNATDVPGSGAVAAVLRF